MSASIGIREVIGIDPGSDRLLPLLGALVVLSGCVSSGAPTSTARPAEPSTGTDADSTATPGHANDTVTGHTPTLTTGHAPTYGPEHANTTLGKRGQPPALESRLYDLVTAENRTAYAAARGLELRNGSVLAVVELRPGRELPASSNLTVRTRYENLVQAFVPVDDLVPIAEHGNVSFVRTPREAATDSLSIDTPHQCSPRYATGESQPSASYCS